jgi:hypothetical protein
LSIPLNLSRGRKASESASITFLISSTLILHHTQNEKEPRKGIRKPYHQKLPQNPPFHTIVSKLTNLRHQQTVETPRGYNASTAFLLHNEMLWTFFSKQ